MTAHKVQTEGQMIQLERVEAALSEHSAVADCTVLARQTKDSGTELVAYVVPTGPFERERLDAHLRSALPPHMVPRAYVPVSCIPLTEDGWVDEHALASLAVIDDELARRWQERLRTIPHVKDTVVLSEQAADDPRPWHLSEIMPDWSAATAAASSASPVTADRPPAQSDRSTSDRPAISHGEKLCEPPVRILADALERAARQAPDNGIVYHQADGSESVQSYPELLADAERILAGLRTLGLRPQDKVIFQLDRAQDFIAAFWACMLGGLVPVPVSIAPSYESENSVTGKLRNAWHMLERPIILTCRRLAPALRSLSASFDMEALRVHAVDDLRVCDPDRERHRGAPDDLALLLLTSGSTGLPKAVMLSHRNLLSRSAGSAQMDGFSRDDISLNWMPLDHVGGIVMFHLRDVYLCCRQIQVPSEVILSNPLRWLDLIERHRATITWAPNFAFALVNDRADEMVRRRWDLSSMRFILNGGEAIVARTARRFIELLTPHGLPATAMRPAWGMSETSSGVTSSHRFTPDTTRDDDGFVEVGGPIPGVSIRTVDERNRVVGENSVGRVQVKGAAVTTGYFRNPEVNREVFTEDGWLNSGDLGVLREGRLTITGREKDIIIVNGVNYYSHEIEAVVEQVEGVEVSFTAACAVRPEGINTDQLAVFFCPAPERGHAFAELLREIRDMVTRKVGINPEFLLPLNRRDIPKTEIGKIKRAELKQRFESGEFKEILKDVDRLLGNSNTLPAWFFRKVWRRKEIRGAPGASSQEGRYLVFLDSLGLGALFCESLRKLGLRCAAVEIGSEFARLSADHYRMNPNASGDYLCLLETLAKDGFSPDQIFHLWTYGAPDAGMGNVEAPEQGLDAGLFSLLFLVQASAKQTGGLREVRLHVISSHAAPTSPADGIVCERGAMPGLLKTIAQELPWMRCRHIDLAVDAASANARRVQRELASDDPEVAYRDGARLVPRLAPLDAVDLKQQALPFKRGGIYLISGGLGGIGSQIAGYLLENYQAKLLLVGRSHVDRNGAGEVSSPNDPAADRARTLEALRKLGEVRYEALDVGDLEGLKQAAERAQSEWHSQIDGVIHLAGTYRERPIVEETRKSLEAALRPKMAGAWALHQLIKDRPGAFLISFSSVNGYFGGFNSGAYSAANSFLDHFSQQLRRRGVQSSTLAWSMWDDVGMSRGYGMKDFTRARGFHVISRRQGLLSFLAGLGHSGTHLFVGLDAAHPEIRKQIDGEPRLLQKLVAFVETDGNGVPVAELNAQALTDRFGIESACELLRLPELPRNDSGEIDRASLTTLPGRSRSGSDRVAPRTEVERRLAEIWQELLHFDQVGIHNDFFDLGGNSLLVTQVISRVRDIFDVDISLGSLFEAPTLAEMAAVVIQHQAEAEGQGELGNVLAELEQLSEEEAQRMLVEATEKAQIQVVDTGKPFRR